MSPALRYTVAAVLLLFAWKGHELSLSWPPTPSAEVKSPQPSPEVMALAAPVREYLPRMLPKDRIYLAHFYDAMAFVLLRDADRGEPIISDTDKFVAFHGSSLRLAIDKADVGKYGDLGSAIDRVFVAAAGADARKIDAELRENIVAACGALSWTFSIHGE